MIYPDYNGGSIVNLTSSILESFDAQPLYPVLKEFKESKELRDSSNVILLVLDGIGYEYLKKNGQDSILNKYLIRKLTSTFPSTTASATTTLKTGVAPQQHGITGWFMFLKELGVVSAILPFRPRYGTLSFSHNGIRREDIFTEKRINEKIKAPSFIIYPDELVDGKVQKKSKNILAYKTLDGLFLEIKKAIKSTDKRKYIYAYWDKFDYLCHREGCSGQKTKEHFLELDLKISSFIKSLEGTNSTLIITADHGLIDTPKSKTILLQDHPELLETLTLPLCGEPRVVYCYVHPSKARQFEDYINKKLDYCCELHKSEDLIQKGLFGLYKPHKMLLERIGDYVLIMKENYIIRDQLLREKEKFSISNHGGMSKEEMFVPLIIKKIS
ncbi:MAG: alkaline phosphatase family protein [Nanoarchaeota archaeon]|nr:alkaline phosphatase family protein [Nanoarchaeota archaeon]